MKTLKLYFTLMLAMLISSAQAQVPKPANAQQKAVAIVGATAHIGNGQVINNSIITFEKGKITLVADATTSKIDLSAFEVIQANGKHVYPGLIMPDTDLGLVEVESVRATRDANEIGDINPNVRALVAYNTDSELIPTLRYNGILLAQATPGSGRISGTSSIMALDGWNWEDAAYRADDGVHMNWMSSYQRPRWWMGETQIKKNERYNDQYRELESFFADVKAYVATTPKTKNLKLEAMKGLFDGSQTLYISASYAKDIMMAVQFAQAQGVQRFVIKGAEQAYLITDFLRDNKVPVILSNVHRLPSMNDEDIDMPFRLPAILHKAGVLVALGYNGTQNSRNLPFFAGTAAAYGLSKEEALQLVTLNTAKIMGIEASAGSLELGKDAHIVISSGDLLDMKSSKVEIAFIHGRLLNLDGKQQLLYKRFKEKYDLK